jgi:hypothetical protein
MSGAGKLRTPATLKEDSSTLDLMHQTPRFPIFSPETAEIRLLKYDNGVKIDYVFKETRLAEFVYSMFLNTRRVFELCPFQVILLLAKPGKDLHATGKILMLPMIRARS